MRTALRASTLVLAAVVGLFGGHTPLEAVAHPWTGVGALRVRPAAAQLPIGFVLPATDVDIKVSALVAADVDADGDLDIVAASGAAGSPRLLVWLNDGGGRLTRQRAAPVRSLAPEPASPSLERRQGGVNASIQPDSPAVEASAEKAWLTLPSRPCQRPGACRVASAVVDTVRSRSPPVPA